MYIFRLSFVIETLRSQIQYLYALFKRLLLKIAHAKPKDIEQIFKCSYLNPCVGPSVCSSWNVVLILYNAQGLQFGEKMCKLTNSVKFSFEYSFLQFTEQDVIIQRHGETKENCKQIPSHPVFQCFGH